VVINLDLSSGIVESRGMGSVGRKLNNYLHRRRLRSARGTVKVWHGEKGWGVLTSPDAPTEVWVHFSAIQGTGYRELRVGESVEFEYRHVANQDGYSYLAVSARRL
jgi:cold shock CspA family protein